jgi:hypothetical protein
VAIGQAGNLAGQLAAALAEQAVQVCPGAFGARSDLFAELLDDLPGVGSEFVFRVIVSQKADDQPVAICQFHVVILRQPDRKVPVPGVEVCQITLTVEFRSCRMIQLVAPPFIRMLLYPSQL